MTQLPIRQLSETDGVGGTTPFAPVTVPEAVMLPDGSTMNKVIGSVAVIETSPAAASHATGDYIVWNGQLYKVTAAISSGQTLVPGTNLTATTAGAELTSLNNDLNDTSFLSGIYGGLGTPIPENSDLDDYTTPGVYRCVNGATAQTLTNCPTTVGFRLEVRYTINTSRMMQIIFGSATDQLFFRAYTGSWSDWKKITTTSV